MDSQTKLRLGSSLKALSLALTPAVASLVPLGCPVWLIITLAVIAALTGAAGVFFSHLFSNDQTDGTALAQLVQKQALAGPATAAGAPTAFLTGMSVANRSAPPAPPAALPNPEP
jgi:hypothetical protein